jgi:hypothetical protein
VRVPSDVIDELPEAEALFVLLGLLVDVVEALELLAAVGLPAAVLEGAPEADALLLLLELG